MEANGPKDPVNWPEVSRSEGAPQKEKCGEKIQQGKKFIQTTNTQLNHRPSRLHD